MLNHSAAPLHVVQPVEGHGVSIFAHQVARTVGAAVEDLRTALTAPRRRVHVHVTDALFGPRCEDAARRLVELGRHHDMTVTLHDVPQPGDGEPFVRRVAAYRAIADSARGWVVSSEHERRLVDRHVRPRRPGAVVHLPVIADPALVAGRPGARGGLTRRSWWAESAPVVGVLGWVYPGKGHAEVIAACSGLGVTVRALGSVAAGHDELVEELTGIAQAANVGFQVAGWVADGELHAALHAVAVPVAAHRSVSASGSINSWLAAGRRPLVVHSPYVAEVDRLRPGSLWRVAPDDLGAAIAVALNDPARTRLGPDVDLRPDLGDVGAAYLAWWASLA